MALPDFFVAGAPKAGTTALHSALSEHPSLYLSTIKEPKYFLSDGPPPRRGGPGDARTYREHVWRRGAYEALFSGASPGALCGESTPFYLYSAAAQRRIRTLIPRAKLIVVLRDPIERAHSNWTHLWSSGLDPIDDFVQACREEQRRIDAGWADFWHYLQLGMYGRQLQHLYTVFPPDQVLVCRYRAMVNEPAELLDTICGFLGVGQGLLTGIPRENVTAHPDPTSRHQSFSRLLRAGSAVTARLPGHAGSAVVDRIERSLQADSRPRQPLTWQQRQALIPHFIEDIRLLESLTGDNYSQWLAPRGDSGGLVGARPSGQGQARNGRPRDR
jgi:hypothetical protein